ncbi:mechanosensitive ion channel family protein [Mycobacterium sp. ITM-2016-00317]|uniref:mechanosensitive ion channel family protein n=1 Tax=Mycobacterium sp. ITM-2016-00317 TaxID=2099694 RepID=UPI00287F9E9D|nr:mechanosensitive ion channel family protein [Mycobacterium sp. ITM-2016-00317]WNG85211.1 mechanosensitive ion channel family protein [Mycobacterium sp. ITM-2016-00317]
MSTVLNSSWLVWAVAVAVGFPVLLVVLTEVHNALRRRGSALARPVQLLRTYILPLGALLLLLVQAMEISDEATSVRLVATLFGVVLLTMVLSGLNATLIQGAPEDSWRRRIPSIFLDVARFALIAVGVTVIMAYVWGANVGGLFTALGVTSIVLGLALQNSVGQIISGLLLLFEQPFRLGDWITVPTVAGLPSAHGRVVEVNWRATHIDTGGNLLVMPNAELAGASFTNYSRPVGEHRLTVVTTFDAADTPDDVCEMLSSVAASLPELRADGQIATLYLGAAEYETSIPLYTPAVDEPVRSMFLRWVWYAARRQGLRLNGVADDFGTPDRIASAMRAVSSTLRLTDDEQQEIADVVRLVRYGNGERLQLPGQVPSRMRFIVEGRVRLSVTGPDGEVIPSRLLERGDFLGQTTLTREPVLATAQALEEVTALEIGRDEIERLVHRKPILLQVIGAEIADRRAHERRLMAESQD